MKYALVLLFALPIIGFTQTSTSDKGELFEEGMWADVYKKKFKDGRIEIYAKKDDKLQRVEFYNLKSERKSKGLPFIIEYFPNGRVSTECYEIASGKTVCLHYADSTQKYITKGYRGNASTLIFKNQKLVEIQTDRVEFVEARLDNRVSTSTPREDHGGCIEKGEFRNYELYNGFIYYYDKKGDLEITDKVSNGVNIYNPEIKINDETIRNSISDHHDRNLNGRLESREAREFKSLYFSQLSDSIVRSVNWSELKKLKNLELIQIDRVIYRLSEFPPGETLKNAILEKKGAAIRSRENFLFEPPPPVPLPIDEQEDSIVLFPEVEATYPGGTAELWKYLNTNLVYPKSAIDNQVEGKVYIKFLIDSKGSISNIQVLRGVSKEFDNEAKRLIREMPNWIPAKHQGKSVPSMMTVPVVINLR